MVAGEWFGLIAREGRAAQTMRKKAWFLRVPAPRGGRLRRHAGPDDPRRDVIAAMRVFEGRGQLPAAHNLRTFVSQVMRYAVINEHADIDPAAAVAGAVARPSSPGLQGITDRRRFGELMRACRSYGGMPQTRAGLLLSAYLAPRNTELRGMRWDEIDFDRARWNVPGARMKKSLDHVVPLPRQALEVLEWIRPHTGRHDLVLYSGQGKRSAMLSEITFNNALRRIGFRREEHVHHGFRTSFSTFLNEDGWNRDWIERQLAHVEGKTVRGAYNKALYLPGRTDKTQAYADTIDGLENETGT